MLRKHISFLILSRAAAIYSPSILVPVSLRLSLHDTPSPLIGQLTHGWASTANNNRAAVLDQILCVRLAVRHKLFKYVSWGHSVMKWNLCLPLIYFIFCSNPKSNKEKNPTGFLVEGTRVTLTHPCRALLQMEARFPRPKWSWLRCYWFRLQNIIEVIVALIWQAPNNVVLMLSNNPILPYIPQWAVDISQALCHVWWEKLQSHNFSLSEIYVVHNAVKPEFGN